jgi:hypothetical protein
VTGTFEVGQKVRHDVRGDVEVSYGPFNNVFGGIRYILRLDDGREVMASSDVLSAIPVTPKFSVGDVVTLATRSGAKATVEYGPFDDRDDIYVVKLIDAPADPESYRTFTAMAHVMTAVPQPEPVQVGDRVRVVRAAFVEEMIGQTGVVTEVGLNWDANEYSEESADIHPYRVRVGSGAGTVTFYVAEVELVEDETTYTHDGVTYDLTAKYSDGDDVWEFTGRRDAHGVPRVTCYGNEDNSDTIADIADDYGPLTRV